jgi:hypothetical protein
MRGAAGLRMIVGGSDKTEGQQLGPTGDRDQGLSRARRFGSERESEVTHERRRHNERDFATRIARSDPELASRRLAAAGGGPRRTASHGGVTTNCTDLVSNPSDDR